MILTDKTALDALLTGTTHVLALGPNEAFVYYQNATRAHMRLPGGTIKHGAWSITPNGYHVDWEGGPSADWQVDKTEDKITYLNAQGEAAGTIIRIVPGDEQGLAS